MFRIELLSFGVSKGAAYFLVGCANRGLYSLDRALFGLHYYGGRSGTGGRLCVHVLYFRFVRGGRK
jgi:hypothetical protein